MLIGETSKIDPLFNAKWEASLRRTFSADNWQKCFIFTHKHSMSSFFQEKKIPMVQGPIRYALYVCFSASDLLECGESEGSFLHIWWESRLITAFWQKVFVSYNAMCISNIQVSPEIALLSMIPGSFSSIKKGILRNCLLAALIAISRHWKSTVSPHILEWAQILNNIMRWWKMAQILSQPVLLWLARGPTVIPTTPGL